MLGRARAHARLSLLLGAGLLVGVIYGLMEVRSPAPPLVLVGLLLGEQIIPVSKQVLAGSALPVAWQESKCTSHLFGRLPGRHAEEASRAVNHPSERPS